MMTFSEMPLRAEMHKALTTLGFTKPTEIQAKAIPALLSDASVDIHGQAQTGTGKTLAFGIPLIHKIDTNDRAVQALIIAPTRELVVQICDSLRAVAKYSDVTIAPIYGGVSMHTQISALKRGVHIVVGTPGRLNDHLRRRTLSLKKLYTFVLDEADIMLDMGFKEEVDDILSHAPDNRQIWLFSATVKSGITALKRKHMSNPVTIKTATQKLTAAKTKQFFCMISSRHKAQAISRFIEAAPSFYGLIFCQTKVLTSELAKRLQSKGYAVGALHGDLNQAMRNVVIKQFKDKEITILVATDVAARGIDVTGLTHVINYTLPDCQDSYVHRIGRTGRAGQEGTAITFVGRRDMRALTSLTKKCNASIDPIEVPSLDDVQKVRVANAVAHLDAVCARPTESNKVLDQLRAAIAERDQQTLANGMLHLLADNFLTKYADEQDIPQVSSSSQSLDGYSHDAVEIMLNVGLDDSLSKEDVLTMITGTCKIESSRIEKVRVIKRKSFIVTSKQAAVVIQRKLNGIHIQGITVRPIIMKEDPYGSRPSHEQRRRPMRRRRSHR